MIRAALASMIVIAAIVPWSMNAMQPAGIAFDDSSSNHLIISTPNYRLTLDKLNGAVLGIKDQHSGAEISQGSNGGCLWSSGFAGIAGSIGGCAYRPTGSNDFSYSWDAGISTLTLRYTGDAHAAQHLDATVTIVANSSPFFDMRLTLDNHAGSPLRNVDFPSELRFKTSAVQYGYVPYYLPGVRVKPTYFSAHHADVPTYPGGNAFADYLSLDIAGSHISLYAVNPAPLPVQPVALGFIHESSNDVCQVQSFCAEHNFQTWVPDGGSWTSPTVRIVIGKDTPSTILSYRRDNGIDTYPSVAAKLGNRFQQYARSPLIKADAWTVDEPFRAWIPILSALPSPALLHPVAYMLGGHDHSYPDFLPPDPTWGSEKDFSAMVQAARGRGLLVMPYTNPTWWTDDSRTVTQLAAPLTIQDISVLDNGKSPVHEAYGPNGGYDVSPFVPFVQARLAQDMARWQTAVPVDCIFEDQIGARSWMLDLNPASPSPISYSQGWLEHTVRYQQQCLMTENGWDRLAATEIGFNGSLLTWQKAFKDPDQFFGVGTWEPYPLALWLLHDKVLMYQHDLALETMSNKPGVLTWNMAFGTMLSYDWQGSGRSWRTNPWLSLITWLQRDVGALFAGQPLQSYTVLAPQVTQTRFAGVRITANWNTRHSYAVRGNQIAPGGFLAQSDNGSIVAGAFTGKFNQNPLSGGTHYLILEQTASHRIVRQPVGADTPVSIDLPSQFAASRVRVVAYDRQGRSIGNVSVSVRSGKVRFQYRQTIGRRPVAYYDVSDGSRR